MWIAELSISSTPIIIGSDFVQCFRQVLHGAACSLEHLCCLTHGCSHVIAYLGRVLASFLPGRGQCGKVLKTHSQQNCSSPTPPNPSTLTALLPTWNLMERSKDDVPSRKEDLMSPGSHGDTHFFWPRARWGTAGSSQPWPWWPSVRT